MGGGVEVGPCWAGHPVGFALLTAGGRQFVAFYDDERRLTVAARRLTELTWRYTQLPVRTEWDSHRYLMLGVDREGYLHLAGNMHNSPLVYFRSQTSYDPESLIRVDAMIGSDESRCTYPRFYRGPEDSLVFTYRDGSSGNGVQFFNQYDEETFSWRRLVDGPVIDGEGKRGVYLDRFRPLLRDAAGWFHLCWVWRKTSDPVTTHDPSYIRSRNLIDWETSDGNPLTLPVTLETAEIVDAVATGSGLINGNICVGLDGAQRPVVSYHKFDRSGQTQLYNARREQDGWRVYQTSDWDYRWEFGGGGTIPFAIRIGPVQVEADGGLSQAFQHVREGTGRWCLDETSLRPTGLRPEPVVPEPPNRRRSHILGLLTNHAEDLGEGEESGARYVLQWETFAANRDRPGDEEIPFATTLRVRKTSGRPAHLTGSADVVLARTATGRGQTPQLADARDRQPLPIAPGRHG